jgi:glucose-1-phosphate adenylyltransferase
MIEKQMPQEPIAGKEARFVSLLTPNTLALVLAGGRGTRLGPLTDWRTKPAVPFGGKFRIIDFTLSNCINSNIRRILLLTQYKSHSLLQHVTQGWSNFNSEFGEFLEIVPAQQWHDEKHWYQGTADAVYQSLDIIDSHDPEYVLILAGDHIYHMDFGEMLASHVENKADITIACNIVPKEEAKGFGVMQVDDTDRIIDFIEKPDDPQSVPGQPDKSLVSMGIYVFSRQYLRDCLTKDANGTDTSHDFGKDVIPDGLKCGDHLQAYRFSNPAGGESTYWRDVGTLDAYYQANMELLSENPPIDIYDSTWPVITYQPQLPPASFTGCGTICHVENSMVSGGCVIKESRLDTSILYSNCKVSTNSELNGVLALPGCVIGKNVTLNNVLLDNQCIIPDGTQIGVDHEADKAAGYHVTTEGIVVVNRKMLGQGGRYLPGIIAGPDI